MALEDEEYRKRRNGCQRGCRKDNPLLVGIHRSVRAYHLHHLGFVRVCQGHGRPYKAVPVPQKRAYPHDDQRGDCHWDKELPKDAKARSAIDHGGFLNGHGHPQEELPEEKYCIPAR